MKERLAGVLVSIALAVGLAACGGEEEQPAQGSGGETAAQALPLKRPGQLLLGAEFPVEGFVELPISDPKGFEVDLAKEIARRLGVQRVTWRNTPFANLFSPAPKPFDFVINEVSITPERDRVVDFSVPYFNANQGYLVKRGGPAEGARSIAEMRDVQFGFQATTTGGDFVEDTIRPTKEPRQYSTLGAATRALANGQIDAFIMDAAIGSKLVEQFPEDIAMPGQFQTGDRYGILFEQGSALRPRVNEALQAMLRDGTVERLQERWFPGTAELPVLR